MRAIYFAHAAGADLLDNPVVASFSKPTSNLGRTLGWPWKKLVPFNSRDHLGFEPSGIDQKLGEQASNPFRTRA